MKPVLHVLTAAAILAALPTLPGCSVYQAYAQRQAIQQAKFSFKSVTLEGVDLAGANLLIVLELENPTDTPLVLDRLDYTLFINDQRAVSGFSDTKATVPPRDVRPIRFRTHVRYADVGAQLRGFLAQKTMPQVRLEGVGHFDTPFGTIDYPVRLFQAQ